MKGNKLVKTFDEQTHDTDNINASALAGEEGSELNFDDPAPGRSAVSLIKPPKTKTGHKQGPDPSKPVKPVDVPTKPVKPVDVPTKPVKPVDVPTKPVKPVDVPTKPVPPKPVQPANASSFAPVSLPEKPMARSKLESFESLVSIAANAASIAVSARDLAGGGSTTQLKDGTVVNHKTETVTLPDGQEVDVNNKIVTHANGSKEEANGDITYPDGRKYIAAQKVMCHVDGSFEYDDGTLADKDGNYIGMRAGK
jgi:hypothetical protein